MILLLKILLCKGSIFPNKNYFEGNKQKNCFLGGLVILLNVAGFIVKLLVKNIPRYFSTYDRSIGLPFKRRLCSSSGLRLFSLKTIRYSIAQYFDG